MNNEQQATTRVRRLVRRLLGAGALVTTAVSVALDTKLPPYKGD
ncbi:MAG TPA: hypothetical protein VJT31_41915 [Rugosimonospora sp.]|nr:hypothetical protein [Rugosimonospora sp.]